MAELTTKQDVFEAIDALLKEGVKPTLRAIQARLGKGSMATLTKYKKAWDALPKRGVQRLPAEAIFEVRVAREMVREIQEKLTCSEEQRRTYELRTDDELRMLREKVKRDEYHRTLMSRLIEDLENCILSRGAFDGNDPRAFLDRIRGRAIREERKKWLAVQASQIKGAKTASLIALEDAISLAESSIVNEELDEAR